MSKLTSIGPELELLRNLLLGEVLARLSRIEAEQRHHAAHAQLSSEELQELRRQWQHSSQRMAAELAQLEKRANDKEALLQALHPVLGDLLKRKIIASGPEMAEIVAPLLSPALKKQVANSKSAMVEALYPIIGPTVARAVRENMRLLVRQINARLHKVFAALRVRLRLASHHPEKILALLCVVGAMALIFLLWHRLR